MTGYEMEEYMKEGKPFYVYGDVMEYNSARGDMLLILIKEDYVVND